MHNQMPSKPLAPLNAPPFCAAGLRVFMAGRLAALDAPGGGEIQMLATARALAARGINASPWRPWEERLAKADCLHLFGTLREHLPLVEAARRQGIPVVLSTIAWYDRAAIWAEPRPWWRRAAGCGVLATRRVCPRLPSWRRQLYHSVDLLMPNSKAEAAQLAGLFGVPRERIHVVPNGAYASFAHASAEPFASLVGCDRFILYAGRIEPRKNQLGFLKALRGSPLPIVVLGSEVPGHERYAAECRRIAGEQVRFVGRFEHDDPLLASAYAACGCLVLASWYETPGLAALEAAMTGTPLVLPWRGCAGEYFGPYARYVDPRRPASIRSAVLSALAAGRDPALAELVRRNYSWDAAARATAEGYLRVVKPPRNEQAASPRAPLPQPAPCGR